MGELVPHWSQAELFRTFDEVKRRCEIDSAFRILVLTDPKRALAKVNPKSLPVGYAVKFVEQGSVPLVKPNDGTVIIEISPALEISRELDEAELKNVAGGKTDPLIK